MTLADALEAHQEAMRYGGRPGISNLALIESALGRPYSGYHRRIFEKAAALLHSLVGNHGFVDGNKRTALLVTELFIERSGYELNIPDDYRFDDIVVEVASGIMGFDDLRSWFALRIIRADPD